MDVVTLGAALSGAKAYTDSVVHGKDSYTKSETDNLLSGKQNALTFDTVPTANSTNPVTSGGLYNVIGDINSVLEEVL